MSAAAEHGGKKPVSAVKPGGFACLITRLLPGAGTHPNITHTPNENLLCVL